MQVRATIRTVSDTLTPDLMEKIRRVSDAGKRQILEAIGLTLVSMAKRSFATDASLRPTPWANKKDGSPSTLTKSTRLRKSIRSQVGGSGLTISSDAAYAAIHQLGGRTRPHVIRARNKKALAFGGLFRRSVRHPGSKIPPRPYLPFYRDGSLTVKASRNVVAIIRAAVEE